VFDIFEKPVNFARDERVLLSSRDSKFPVDWSPDGESLLFTTFDEVGGDELWTLPFRDPEKPIKFLSGSSQGQFSPDGRWVAYRSNESGRWEIYVRPYPESGGQQLVSRGGGIQPRWRRDGAELFYIGADRRLMAVPMRLPSQGGALEIGAAVSLFSTRLANPTNQQFGYAAAPDGQRFLMSIVADQTTTTPITVVQNWMGNVFKPEAR
jgi:Tol biopolymer transport system component